jgi:hypothetical protein
MSVPTATIRSSVGLQASELQLSGTILSAHSAIIPLPTLFKWWPI